MGLSAAVDWWEESQLRVLVLSSLVIQWLLFLSSMGRRYAIPGWRRAIIWLAYLGSDAVAIYGLATLFNRHKNQDRGSHSILEVVWAPVLLMHLGGQDGITAYNLEDNELWTRHATTALSQITVAVYVFSKSWPPGGDKKLLQAAIMLFFIGIIKCLDKPWALNCASINNLVSSSHHAERRGYREEKKIDLLQDYVEKARVLFVHPGAQEEGARASRRPHQAQEEGDIISSPQEGARDDDKRKATSSIRPKRKAGLLEEDCIELPSELFVDLARLYSDRLRVLESFSVLSDKCAYLSLQRGVSNVFNLLYTKLRSVGFSPLEISHIEKLKESGKETEATFAKFMILFRRLIMLSRVVLPWAAIGLFHKSHREAYNDSDVKVTYALIVCGALLEYFSTFVNAPDEGSSGKIEFPFIPTTWEMMVAQYSLIGFFARNKKHRKKLNIVRLLGCKDFLDQKWCMKSCFSSRRITTLVLQHLRDGWKSHIQDTASYWEFNDYRGQGTLKHHKCNEELGWSLKGPFDESVLLWHIATDICFYSSQSCAGHTCTLAEDTTMQEKFRKQPEELRKKQQKLRELEDDSSPHQTRPQCEEDSAPSHEATPQCGALAECQAVRSRQLSNYMMYLLFVKPEMLLPGSRRNLFTTAYDELKDILKEIKQKSTKRGLKQISSSIRNRFGAVYGNLKGFLKPSPMEKGCMQRPISLVRKLFTTVYGKLKGIFKRDKPQVEEERLMKNICSKLESTKCSEQVFIHDAWKLAEKLQKLGDEKKMWEVIQGVWVEMLCFSAGRCRGYLHAKALGTGGELLTYIWLLMSHMGMETLTERLQREERGNAGTSPSSSAGSTSAASSTSDGAAPQTADFPTGTTASASQVLADTTTPPTNEIRIMVDDK